MLIKNTRIIVFLLMPLFVACQTVRLDTVCAIPQVLSETSGLYVESANAFWSFNDSGGEAALFQFDSMGIVRKKVLITNASNIDWEEIAVDPVRRILYIADFGNNANSRRDLAIYKIALPTDKPVPFPLNLPEAVTAEKIEFSYDDQTAFPPPDAQKAFDAEAMLIDNDSIFIFTKDFDSNPYSGKSVIYGLPTTTGKHIAKRIGTFKTDDSWKFNGAITAAARSTDGKILLMSYQKLWAWNGLRSVRELLNTTPSVFSFGLNQFAQREAIAFDWGNNCTAYMTSEKAANLGGNLTRLNICRLLSRTKDKNPSQTSVKVQPTPSVGDVALTFSEPLTSALLLKIVNTNGQTIVHKEIQQYQDKILVENTFFPTSGVYFYALFEKDHTVNSVGKIVVLK